MARLTRIDGPDFRSRSTAPVTSPGVSLIATLTGHRGFIGKMAWSSDGTRLASPAEDQTIRIWRATDWTCSLVLAGHSGEVFSCAFTPDGHFCVSGSADQTVKFWDPTSGDLHRTLKWDHGSVNSIAFDATGSTLALAGDDSVVTLFKTSTGVPFRDLEGRQDALNSVVFDPVGGTLATAGMESWINLWNVANGQLLRTLKGHRDAVNSVVFDPSGRILISGGADGTVRLWEVASGRLMRTIEGPTDRVRDVAISPDGKLIAAKCQDDKVRLWDRETFQQVALIPEPARPGQPTSLVFHPHLPLLACVGSDPGTRTDEVIHVWELNRDELLRQAPVATVRHYQNAKIVILGDTGVGKSALSLVLNQRPFEATVSTPGRSVVPLFAYEVNPAGNRKQVREAFLWDLAGQPGYRVIHQLHLSEVAVALIVFDARSETDPLAGVRHWDRALRLAQQRQGTSSVPLKKFLVSARSDRGHVAVSKERLANVVHEFGFDGYFETSAKEGWQIAELRRAIELAIPWNDLPDVTSSALFAKIKQFLLQVKQSGRLIEQGVRLFDEFSRANPDDFLMESNLGAQFNTCISRLENRDLIRRLTFGGYVLLQPELLDAYASAMVNAAREEPQGLGSISEDLVLQGRFFVPVEHRITDAAQEQLLLHATVEELTRHDLALRESSLQGRFLVFPSQFSRDYEEAPDPRGKSLVVTFDGPIQSLYATLAVRLGHSGLFAVSRTDMWRNAALFNAAAGGKCGLCLEEITEAKGRLTLFYDPALQPSPSAETRYHFEQFVLSHVKQYALDQSVVETRFCVCEECGETVPDGYVQKLRKRGIFSFDCPCGGKVSLADPLERLRFISQVGTMEQAANDARQFELFVESARGEACTASFQSWAGDDRVTLAIVFTDIAGSTALNRLLKDERMQEIRKLHFSRNRDLIEQFKGRELKTLGDGFMAVFRSVEKALDYALALHRDPGEGRLKMRAGIHIGPVDVAGNDVFGTAVNFAARVVDASAGAEIWLSDQAKDHLDKSGWKQHADLQWQRHDGLSLKGFESPFTLWSITNLPAT